MEVGLSQLRGARRVRARAHPGADASSVSAGAQPSKLRMAMALMADSHSMAQEIAAQLGAAPPRGIGTSMAKGPHGKGHGDAEELRCPDQLWLVSQRL
jgi:hypothetical protein